MSYFDDIDNVTSDLVCNSPEIEREQCVTFEVEVIETVRSRYRLDAPYATKSEAEEYVKNAYWKERLGTPDSVSYDEPEFKTHEVILFNIDD